MSQTPEASSHAAPAWRPLDATQRRVLGVMIEKAKTTPGAYPMTVNAIVTGCNQKNNREPVTVLDDFDVEKALDDLRTLGVASEIDWLGRVAKHKHHAYEWLGVSRLEMAVMAELLLRGAQALGDLRGRAARLEPIADLAALKPIVDGLVGRGLMLELTAPGRGQVVSHNLYLPQELRELRSRYAGHAPRDAAGIRDEAAMPPVRATPASERPLPEAAREGTTAGPVVALTAQVAELRAEVARLQLRVGELEARLPAARD